MAMAQGGVRKKIKSPLSCILIKASAIHLVNFLCLVSDSGLILFLALKFFVNKNFYSSKTQHLGLLQAFWKWEIRSFYPKKHNFSVLEKAQGFQFRKWRKTTRPRNILWEWGQWGWRWRGKGYKRGGVRLKIKSTNFLRIEEASESFFFNQRAAHFSLCLYMISLWQKKKKKKKQTLGELKACC